MKKPQSTTNPEQTQPTIADLQQQNGELLADLQRTRADFENFRKQIDLQKETEKKSTKFATVSKILPLLDNLSIAFSTYEQLEPLKKSFDKTMSELGLSTIDSTPNTAFNPDLHDAIMAEGDGDTETIQETLRPGYYYEGEVLRPAMVKVQRS